MIDERIRRAARIELARRDFWSFCKLMLHYQKEGKNAHDDAPDATTGVAEQFTRKGGVSVW